MPTDRMVTINIQEFGTYNAAGNYQDGADGLHRRWVTLVDTSLERQIIPGGARAEADAVYRTRYFRALAEADIRITYLIEDDGDRYSIESIKEVTGRDGNVRRRWLELECLRPDPNRMRDLPTEDEVDEHNTMDMMGGLMAAPTFTELATVTEGGTSR